MKKTAWILVVVAAAAFLAAAGASTTATVEPAADMQMSVGGDDHTIAAEQRFRGSFPNNCKPCGGRPSCGCS
jgi:hypothetical protein